MSPWAEAIAATGAADTAGAASIRAFCAPSTRPRFASGVASIVATPSAADIGPRVRPTTTAPASTSHGAARRPITVNPAATPTIPVTNQARRDTLPTVAE